LVEQTLETMPHSAARPMPANPGSLTNPDRVAINVSCTTAAETARACIHAGQHLENTKCLIRNDCRVRNCILDRREEFKPGG